MNSKIDFYNGVAMERRNLVVKRKIGKMIVDLYQNHQIIDPLSPTIELDTGIVAQSKKYSVSTSSLHKYLWNSIFTATSAWNNKKSIILGVEQMKDIQAVIDLFLYWKGSRDSKGSKQIIETVFSYLFLR